MYGLEVIIIREIEIWWNYFNCLIQYCAKIFFLFYLLGCRFIQEHRSNSSNPFLPLINLEKNGTLHLKVALKGIYRCNQYHLFSKRPFERAWVNFKGENIFKTEWHQTDRSDLTIEVRKNAYNSMQGVQRKILILLFQVAPITDPSIFQSFWSELMIWLPLKSKRLCISVFFRRQELRIKGLHM